MMVKCMGAMFDWLNTTWYVQRNYCCMLGLALPKRRFHR
jgi:hypothetical protein